MIVKLLVLFIALNLAGCKLDNQPTAVITQTPDVSPIPSDTWAVLDTTGINLKVKIPTGWEMDNTDSGIILTEHMGKPETGGILEGIVVYIFIPPLDEFPVNQTEDTNVAWQIMKQIIKNPDYVGNALVSEPVAFDWDRHDAAYYLLNNRDGTVTLLLAIGLGDDQRLAVFHISLPEDQADRLRPMLPELLGSLTIDDIAVDVSALRQLPDPLVFPVNASPTP